MVRKSMMILLALEAALAQHPTIGVLGTISGTLKGEDGAGLAGVVTIRRVGSRATAVAASTKFSVATEKDGTFRLGALPLGAYTVCARALSSPWLDSCDWGGNPQRVSISSSQATSKVDVALRRGGVVTIRIDDPSGVLALHEGRTSGAGLLVGIVSDGLMLRLMPVVSRDSGGRSLQMAVPYDRDAKLIVRTSFYRMADNLGLALQKGRSTVIPFRVPSGRDPGVIALKITGTEP